EQGTTPKTTGFADRLIREDPAFRNALANLAEGLRGNGSPALDEMANRIVDQVEKGGTKIG
ncbi:MAG: hypothetical protein Q7S00_04335, partial [bacterium]|nr:hypothetical protein [bacterium]